jgi:single-strand DNA-binding protein
MANYNKVILVGNLTRDPQLSYLPSQTAVCEIGLAVNRRWRGQDGQQREETCFVDCKCFGRQAETLNQYMAKGRQLLVEGRLTLDTWETQDGQKRSKHRVVIENFQFLDSGGGGGAGGGGQRQAPQRQAPRQAPPAQGGYGQDEYSQPDPYEQSGPGEDEIPF